MNVPEILTIVPAYLSSVKDANKELLESDAWASYDSITGDACAKYMARATMIDWTNCRGFGNREAMFVMTYKGQLFLTTYLELREYIPAFEEWVEKVFRPAAHTFYYEDNNQGAWGLLGCVLADRILHRPTLDHVKRFYDYVSKATDIDGTMKYEILRTNSGMWYSYFALTPLLRVTQLIDVDPWLLFGPIRWLFKYVEEPATWPYKLGPWWMRWAQKMIHPCADEVELPRKDNWPADLYHVAGNMFGMAAFRDWGNPPPYLGVNIFRRGE
jgi:hypothetical protein